MRPGFSFPISTVFFFPCVIGERQEISFVENVAICLCVVIGNLVSFAIRCVWVGSRSPSSFVSWLLLNAVQFHTRDKHCVLRTLFDS